MHSAIGQKHNVFLTIIALLLGLMLMVAVNTNRAAEVKVDSDTAELIAYIEDMEAQTVGLQDEIKAARLRIETIQAGQSEDQALTSAMGDSLIQLNIRAGLTELAGPGLTVILDDNTVGAELAQKNNPAAYNPSSYIVHDKDILYIVRALAPSAEAISVNGLRVVDNTSVRCVGSVILINSTRLAPPYEIRAIGNIEALTTALVNSGRYNSLLYSNIPIKYAESANIAVPAYTGAYSVNYSTAKGGI